MCDTIALIGGDGLLFAKNSDRHPTEMQLFEAFPRRAAGGTVQTQYLELPDRGAAAFVGSRPSWLWGVEHGVNEHGVVIGNERLYTADSPKRRPPALLGMDLVRLGLEGGRTAEEAVDVIADLLEHHGQGGSGDPDSFDPYDSSFMVADHGGGWLLETSHRTWAARPIGRGASISNRISLTTDWTRGSPDLAAGRNFQEFRHPRVATALADHRLVATGTCVARGAEAVGPRDLAAVLRDHGTGPWGAPGRHEPSVPPPTEVGDDFRGVTVCMHVRDRQATTGAMICAVGEDPMATRVWVALGAPCVSVFVPLRPVDGVPPALSDAQQWRLGAARRDVVERDPTALAAVREELDPIETELWESAV